MKATKLANVALANSWVEVTMPGGGFEYDSFHIQQPAYPSGYVFWVSEVFDKSPVEDAGRRIA